MKKRSVLLMLCLFAASCGRETPPVVTVSLIPDSPGKTPSYWCTWGAQNYAADEKALAAATGLEGHSSTYSFQSFDSICTPLDIFL